MYGVMQDINKLFLAGCPLRDHYSFNNVEQFCLCRMPFLKHFFSYLVTERLRHKLDFRITNSISFYFRKMDAGCTTLKIRMTIQTIISKQCKLIFVLVQKCISAHSFVCLDTTETYAAIKSISFSRKVLDRFSQSVSFSILNVLQKCSFKDSVHPPAAILQYEFITAQTLYDFAFVFTL